MPWKYDRKKLAKNYGSYKSSTTQANDCFVFFNHIKSQFILQITSYCAVCCPVNPNEHLRAQGDIMFLTTHAVKHKLNKQTQVTDLQVRV